MLTIEEKKEVSPSLAEETIKTLREEEEKAIQLLANASPKALTDLLYFGLITKQGFPSTHTLFNALLNGHVTQIQSFNKKGIGRRVFVKPSESNGEPPLQTYTLCKDGKEEEWTITTDNLNKNIWAEIPGPAYYVGYGIALEALLTGKADFIRDESWTDPTTYLTKETRYIDGKPQQLIINARSETVVSISQAGMTSRKWIMIKLPTRG